MRHLLLISFVLMLATQATPITLQQFKTLNNEDQNIYLSGIAHTLATYYTFETYLHPSNSSLICFPDSTVLGVDMMKAAITNNAKLDNGFEETREVVESVILGLRGMFPC